MVLEQRKWLWLMCPKGYQKDTLCSDDIDKKKAEKEKADFVKSSMQLTVTVHCT